MSKLRPECSDSKRPPSPDSLVLQLIYAAVRRRRSLIHGTLHKDGKSCAMGAFWDDNPGRIVSTALVEEIAAVNDSVPPTALPSARRRHVYEWLKWKLKI